MNYEDSKVYDFLNSGKSLIGIFQLGASAGMADIVRQVVPESIEDIATVIALYRPAHLKSGLAFDYGNYKTNPRTIHPLFDKHTRMTGGVMLYQEQIMKVFSEISSLGASDADILRKIIGKKIKDHPDMKRYHKIFIDNGLKKGLTNEQLELIWNEIEAASGYSFNKSHAISYAMLTYQTAWFRVNEPLAFFASSMDVDRQSLPEYMIEIAKENINIKGVDINISTTKFEIDKKSNTIILPLNFIKGVGNKASAYIVTERNVNGSYTSCEDFRMRLPKRSVNKRVVKALYALGAFDNFNDVNKLGIDADDIIKIKQMKKWELEKTFIGFVIPTKKMLKYTKYTYNLARGIVIDKQTKVRKDGTKYFKIKLYPNKIFYANKQYNVDVGDLVTAKVVHKSIKSLENHTEVKQ